MAIQRKHQAPPVLPRKEKLGDRIPSDGPHRQSLLHGGPQLGQGMLFQPPQPPDVFAGAFAFVLVFQPAAQPAEAFGQDPPGQRAGVIQRAGLALQQRQIMPRLKANLLLLPDPLARSPAFVVPVARRTAYRPSRAGRVPPSPPTPPRSSSTTPACPTPRSASTAPSRNRNFGGRPRLRPSAGRPRPPPRVI
jgi:hypothetical protein